MGIAELAAAVVVRLFAPAIKEATQGLADEARQGASRLVTKLRDKVRDLLNKHVGSTEVLEDVEDKKVDPKVLQDLLEKLLAEDKAAADDLAKIVQEHTELTNTGNIVNIDAGQTLSQVWAQTITGPVVNYGSHVASSRETTDPP